MRTRFGKLTGHHSGDGTCELTDCDKYILEKLQFLERHVACTSSRQTCSVSIKFIHQHTCHHISTCALSKCKYQYVKLLNAIKCVNVNLLLINSVYCLLYCYMYVFIHFCLIPF